MGNFLGFGRGDNAVRPLQYTRMNLPGQPEQSAADRTSLYGHDGSTNLQALFSDPAAQAYMRTMAQYGVDSRTGGAARQQLERRADQLGASLPPHSRWAVGPNGTVGYQSLDVNNDIVYPLATVGAAGGLGLGAASAAGAFSGGAATSGGLGGVADVGANVGAIPGATSAGSLAAPAAFGSVPGSVAVGAVPSAVGMTAGGVPTGAAAAGGGGAAAASPWLSNSALGLYSSVGQSVVQGIMAHRAAQQQERAAQAALDLQRQVLAQQQQNQMPYMQAGNASLQRLNSMLTPQGQAPAQVDGPNGPGQMITVISPDGGQRMERPASEAQHWAQLGATIQMNGSAGGGSMGGGGGMGLPVSGNPNARPSARGRAGLF